MRQEHARVRAGAGIRQGGIRQGIVLVTVVALAAATLALTSSRPAGAATLPSGFTDSVALGGLSEPTGFAFAPDGRVFVIQKNGVVKVFGSVTDPSGQVVADLSAEVDDYWDRGMLGLALDPQFPSRPYLYVSYTYDHVLGDPAPPPRWGDDCPYPPGATTDGCVVSGRLSRLTLDPAAGTIVAGGEKVLLEDWCQQFPSHSVGDLGFGRDGMLYVSGGEGASFTTVDYGQLGALNAGDRANPCGDPPGGAGTALSPPSAQGGALRAQSVRRPASQHATLSGALLRVDPDTGAAAPGNPLQASADAKARRIVAYGLRNPFRFTFRPGTDEVWLGDVGWNTWEEIDRVASPTAGVRNFGWPCYEGVGQQPAYRDANLTSCKDLYAAGTAAPPHYTYKHGSSVVSGDGCGTGGSSVSGLAFYGGASYPAKYRGALLFADYSRDCIWAMLRGTNGLPDPSQREVLVSGAANPVDLETGPGGDLFYADLLGGAIRRVTYTTGTNRTPIAVATATPSNGPAPLHVTLDGSGSSDPDTTDTLSYAWDLDGDGAFDDSTAAKPTFTYANPGVYAASLRVTDNHGASSVDTVHIAAGNTAPTVTIDGPPAGTTWKVGDLIAFSGHATDAQDGGLPSSALSWSAVLHHCTSPTTCHVHPLRSWTGTATGSFNAPDHDWPSWLELTASATDSGGLTGTARLRLNPKTVVLTFASSPTGLKLTVGSGQGTTAFTRTAIVGSTHSVSAPSRQTLDGKGYAFASWSDGGAQTHLVTAGSSAATYAASYRRTLTLTFTTSASTVPYARPVTLTGRLVGSGTTNGVPGQPISVYGRPAGTKTSFTLLGTVKTDTLGRFVFQHRPTANIEYTTRFWGSAAYPPTGSANRVVGVSALITTTLAPTTIRLGGTATISGRVINPAHVGETLYLQLLKGGGVWTTIRSATLGADEQYRFTVRPNHTGPFKFRLVNPADSDHVQAVSATLTLTVV